VKHFKRPEGNVTGVAILTGDLMPKRVQILAEMVPGALIGVLMNPTTTVYDPNPGEIEKAGRALQANLVFATASTDADLDSAVASLTGQQVGALLAEAEPFLGNRWQLLVPLAARYGIPMLQEWREAVAAGG